MSKADLKYKKWVFTWNAEEDKNMFIPYNHLIELLESIAESYVFQTEEVTRIHHQGMFILPIRKRKQTLLNEIEAYFKWRFWEEPYSCYTTKHLTLERMLGTEEEAIAYCTKKDSRISGPFYSRDLRPYIPVDLKIFEIPEAYYSWQRELMISLFDTPFVNKKSQIVSANDRTITFILDPVGNSGKSKFTKFLCYTFPKSIVKLAFGSAQQLRSAIISTGPKQVYFIDLPRTLGTTDHISDIISALEDLKNGFITTSMYGKYQYLLIEPPHIIIFSNNKIDIKLMSADRWDMRQIMPMKNLKKIRMSEIPPVYDPNLPFLGGEEREEDEDNDDIFTVV